MRHSLNEIEVTLRKATIGAGIPVGLAQDIGQAAAWLAACGMDGAGAGLAAITGKSAAAIGQVADGGAMTFTDASVAYAGPSAMDFLAAGHAVQLTGMDAPLLLVGLAGVAATTYDLDIACDFGAAGVVSVTPDGLSGDLPAALGRDVNLTASPATSVANDTKASAAGIEVADAVWNNIVELAGKTYVPESEASRLLGAGAGLTDND